MTRKARTFFVISWRDPSDEGQRRSDPAGLLPKRSKRAAS